ncbi:MAG: TetR/AcrR family transcriptional regulator [Acidimicrobiia bacterium]|nr:MAG: TetR/AcrR family transcriptional regulator [Acidimicrobiia bacterium]
MDDDVSPRSRIILAAIETIADRTIGGTRMREIAKRAGLGLGHVHYYFSSQSDLLLAVLDHIWDIFAEERDGRLENSDLEESRRYGVFFDQQRRILEDRADLLAVRLDYSVQGTSDKIIEAKIQGGYAEWRARIAEQIEKGVLSAETLRIAPDLCIAIMEGAVLQYFNEPESMDVEAYFRVAKEMVAAHLSPPR